MKKIAGILFTFAALKCFPQFITNPSFENTTGAGRVPNGWTVCEQYSTPDTQPGAFGCRLAASHGNTYASLCGRTDPAPSSGFTEDFETQLLKPLKKGRCYSLKMDLAYSTEFFVDDFGTYYYFNHSMKLAVFGSNGGCSKQQTLAVTSTVLPDTWKTYEYTLTPVEDVRFLRLYSMFSGNKEFCNILVDNIRLTEIIAETSQAKDTLVVKGSRLKLDALEGTNFEWSPPNGLSCTTCKTPEFTVNASSIYTVSYQKGAGCELYQRIFKVGILTKESFFLPNVITPNGDGYNDTFRILPLPPNCELTIMNRIGEVLYKTANYDNMWDGRYNGQLLTPDTYWYFFRYDKNADPITGYIYVKQVE